MGPYSTVRGWLVRMMQRDLGRRFDQKSTGRKNILGPQTLKKIMEWTCWDPSRYGFEPTSWHLNMVNEMIRMETGRHAKPSTLRRILHRLGLSYSKPRPVPCKTAPTGEQNMFNERVKRTILGVSGHGYAVLAVDEAGILRETAKATVRSASTAVHTVTTTHATRTKPDRGHHGKTLSTYPRGMNRNGLLRELRRRHTGHGLRQDARTRRPAVLLRLLPPIITTRCRLFLILHLSLQRYR